MSKSWFVMGQTEVNDNKKQQIIQIGKDLELKVLKGINKNIIINLNYKRFSFSEETSICGCLFNLNKILEKPIMQPQKVYAELVSPKEHGQILAVLYLEI